MFNGIKKKYSLLERKQFPFVYLLIAFPVLQFLVFWVYLNFSSILLAFKNGVGEFTFSNFEMVFKSFTNEGVYGQMKGTFGESLLHSLTIWVVTYVICFPISIITTYILFRRVWGHYVFRIIYILPSLMGAIVFTALMKYMLTNDGFITILLSKIIDLPPAAIANGLFGCRETAFKTMVFLTFIMGLVGNNVVLTGAFSRLPDELFESAMLDGAGFWKSCFAIAIPCAWPTISTLLTFGLCSIFLADNNAYLYSNGTGDFGMTTVGFQIYYMTYNISLNGANTGAYGYPAAVGLLLTFMTMPVVLIGKWALEKTQGAMEM